MSLETIIYILILIYSIILHEIAHGYVAYLEGDNTAKWAGRLTLNPIPHVDVLGSIIVPIVSYISAGAAVGWAKGVPYNPHMLKHRYSEARVAIAGVAMNFLIAIVFSFIYRYVDNDVVRHISGITVVVNVSLGIFNLLPLPPFDGLRVITSIFPSLGHKWMRLVDLNPSIFLIFSIIIAFNIWPFIRPIVMMVLGLLL